MEIRLEDARGGACWNSTPIDEYVAGINVQEARFAKKPNTVVYAGQIACEGCDFNKNLGRTCNATVQKTVILTDGEPNSRADVAGGIPHFRPIEPTQHAKAA